MIRLDESTKQMANQMQSDRKFMEMVNMVEKDLDRDENHLKLENFDWLDPSLRWYKDECAVIADESFTVKFGIWLADYVSLNQCMGKSTMCYPYREAGSGQRVGTHAMMTMCLFYFICLLYLCLLIVL